MSKLIADLLGMDRRSFEEIVQRLDHMTIRSSIDVRLSAEIITQSREKIRGLGLDPADTTHKELYFALLARAERDGELLRKKLGITDSTKPVDAAAKIANSTQKLLSKEIVISMQPTVVKKILKAVPPKRTMKALKFRSIDSVLKRENPLVLYALAKKLEEKTWHSQVHARLKRLQPRDVKENHIQVLSLPADWLEKLKKQPYESVVQSVPEIGSVLIMPSMPLKTKGSVLLTSSLVLQAGERLTVESLPYRTRALTVGYEKLLPDVAAGILDELKPIHGLSITWNAAYKFIAEQGKYSLPDFEFVLGDLQWEDTETKIAALVPELDYWVNNHYLGLLDGSTIVSMHLVDVAASLVLGRDYGEQVVSHLQSSLWNELQIRYLKHESLEKSVVSQLTMAQGIVV